MSLSPKGIYDWYRNTLRNPKYRWWIVLGTLAYLISPFDIAPDFLPIIGQVDDVLIATLLFSELSQMGLEFFKKQRGTVQPEDITELNTEEKAAVEVNSISLD